MFGAIARVDPDITALGIGLVPAWSLTQRRRTRCVVPLNPGVGALSNTLIPTGNSARVVSMTLQTVTRENPVVDASKVGESERPIFLQAWFLVAIAVTIFGVVQVVVN